MTKHSLKQLIAIALTLAGVGPATLARSETCSNSCVTMAIPRADGVYTKLDGSADAALWPPSHELRTIRIAAINDRDARCDVTINDVRQDEAPGVTSGGVTIDDAVNCTNVGDESSVDLRSDRADGGSGRSYHVSFTLADPDCKKSAKADEVLIVVPRDDSVTSLKPPDEDMSTLTASYSGDTLKCSPPRDPDRLARRESNR